MWLHCAKVAEWIEMFGMKTLETQGTVCYNRCFDLSTARGRGGWEFRPLYSIRMTDQIAILFMLETLEDPRDIVLDGDRESRSPTATGDGIDAVFAKLLWPLVTSYVFCSFCECANTGGRVWVLPRSAVDST